MNIGKLARFAIGKTGTIIKYEPGFAFPYIILYDNKLLCFSRNELRILNEHGEEEEKEEEKD